MRALPAIKTAVGISLAGIDYRPFLGSTDEVERMVEVVVADEAFELRRRFAEQRRRALAQEVGGYVGNVVGRAMSATLQSIARAMRS